MAKVLNILLVTNKLKLLNLYALSYLKRVDTSNTLKTVEKICLFYVRDDNVLDKYNKIWGKIKEKLNIKFHSKPVYDETYIKVKVREFDGKIRTIFLGNEVPKENIYYTCIACITIDSVMKTDKKNYPQVYLEQCKYKVKKIQMFRFINTKLESDSESDLKAESKSDTGFMTKLKSSSYSDSE